jgi:hypothetical protein
MFSLLRKALESSEGVDAVGVIATPPADTPPVEGQVQEPTIVMNGPLSEIFSRALNVAYAKTDPVTGEAIADGAVLESQANDQIDEAAGEKLQAPKPPTFSDIILVDSNAADAPTSTGGAAYYDSTPLAANKGDVIQLVEQLTKPADSPDWTNPADFVFYTDHTDSNRAADCPNMVPVPKGGTMEVAVESITIFVKVKRVAPKV